MAAFDQTNRTNIPINVFRFMVQLQESDSVTGLNNEKTGEQVFKTVASTRVPSLDNSQLRVSYHCTIGRHPVNQDLIIFTSNYIPCRMSPNPYEALD